MSLRFVAVALTVALCSLPAFAEDAEESTTFLGIPNVIWLTANLVIFLGLLGKFLGPGIIEFLDTRGAEIRENLALAKKQQKEVAEMKTVLEKKVADLEAEMDHVLERARTDGEKEREQILAQAQHESERLLKQADEEIQYRFTRARQELTEHTAKLSAELARKKLESQLGEQEQRRLFDENLQRLERDVS